MRRWFIAARRGPLSREIRIIFTRLLLHGVTTRGVGVVEGEAAPSRLPFVRARISDGTEIY